MNPMRVAFFPALLAIAGISALTACRPSFPQVATEAPANAERSRTKGLGKTGWAAEVEVELLEEGETREDWTSRSPNQTPVTPIVLDVDAAGN